MAVAARRAGPNGSRPRAAGDVNVLHKALDVLEFLGDGKEATVAELCAGTALAKPTAYRILTTLERRAYVTRTAGRARRYALGPALHGLTRAVRSTGDLIAAARPMMQALHEEFGETVNLGVLANGGVVYVDAIESTAGLRTSVELGSTDPVHCTALGKALLAALDPKESRHRLREAELVRRTPRTITSVRALLRELDETRERGYAVDDEENEGGSRCISAAVRDRDGTPVAALSVSGPAARLADELLHAIGRRTRTLCAELSAALG